MQYMGSKRRVAKEILPIILEGREYGQPYIEPFVGSASVIERVTGPRAGYDANPYVIALHKAVQAGWQPPTEITREQYGEIRLNKEGFPPELVGFAGFGCAHFGSWFGGYAHNSKNENYALRARNSLLKQKDALAGCHFECSDYQSISMPQSSIVYCDPPYNGVSGYLGVKDKFDSTRFWAWCDRLVDDGHTVFVSEYAAPEHWRQVWERKLNTTGWNKRTHVMFVTKATEKLFTRTA